MAAGSKVNPNYPIPGVDQSSRGFRDNFSTIKQEIENLQSKQILLTGDVTSEAIIIDSGNGVMTINTTIITNNVSVSGNNHSLLFNNDGTINSSNVYYDNGNSFVGIGTSTPRAALDIKGGNVRVGNTIISDGLITTIHSANLQIGNNGNIVVTINSNKQVGIGRNPARTLDVTSNDYDVSRFTSTASNLDTAIRLTSNSTTGSVSFVAENQNAYAGGIRVDTQGLVSINAGDSAGAGLSAQTRAIVIDPITRNVSVGNVSPTTNKLSVDGNIQITGNSTVNGLIFADGSFQTTAATGGGGGGNALTDGWAGNLNNAPDLDNTYSLGNATNQISTIYIVDGEASGNWNVNGVMFVNTAVVSSGPVVAESQMYVDGDISASAGLGVNGNVQVGGAVNINGLITVGGSAGINGDTNIEGNLYVATNTTGGIIFPDNSVLTTASDPTKLNANYFGTVYQHIAGVTDDGPNIQALLDAMNVAALAGLAQIPPVTTNNELLLSGDTFYSSIPLVVHSNQVIRGTSGVPYNTANLPYSNGENFSSGTTLKALSPFNVAALPYTGLVNLMADNSRVDSIVIDGDLLPHGTWYPSITCTTAQGNSVSKQLLIPIANPGYGLSVKTYSIPPFYTDLTGEVFQMTADGGVQTGNYVWSITSGTLPTGLSMNSSGLISGTPTVPGSNSVTFSVTDGTTTATATFNVSVPAAFININSLWNVTLGEVITPYTIPRRSPSLSANCHWMMFNAPAGMVINSSTGAISGTITAASADYISEVWLFDLYSVSYLNTLSVSVVYGTATGFSNALTTPTPSEGLFWINPTTRYMQIYVSGVWYAVSGVSKDKRWFPIHVYGTNDGVQVQNAGGLSSIPEGSAYSMQFRAEGGGGSYTWSIALQSFPPGYDNGQAGYPTTTSPGPGLTLSSSGLLSGTPTATGSYNFFVKAVSTINSANYWAALVILNVNSAGSTPIFLGGQFPTGVIGVAYSGQPVVQSIPSAEPYVWTANQLPTGLSIDSATGAITGTPQASAAVNGITLTWGAQVRDVQVRGFRAGSGIYTYGPTNLHRIKNFMLTECYTGLNFANQTYDSHIDEGYIYSNINNINMQSGAAGNNINGIRLEYCFEHNVIMQYANQNSFTNCYWDTSGFSALYAINCEDLIVNNNRFFRSARMVRGPGSSYKDGAYTGISNHISLTQCLNAKIDDNHFHLGSTGDGSSHEILNTSDPFDFIHPATCIWFYDCQGLSISSSNLVGRTGDQAISYAGGSLEGVTVDDNVIRNAKSSIKIPYLPRSIPGDPIIANGSMSSWPVFQQSQTLLGTNPLGCNLADDWLMEHDTSASATTTMTRQTIGTADNSVPFNQYLYVTKPANAGTAPGTYVYQHLLLKYQLRKYLWNLSGRNVIISWYAKSANANNVLPRILFYAGSSDNAYTVTSTYGSRTTVSSTWTRMVSYLTMPDISGISIGTAGDIEIGFILDDGSQNYDFSISGLRLDIAEPNFIPNAYRDYTVPRVTQELSNPMFVPAPMYVTTTTGNVFAQLTTDGLAGGTTNMNIIPANGAIAFSALCTATNTASGDTAVYTLTTAMKRGNTAVSCSMVGNAATTFTCIASDTSFGTPAPQVLLSADTSQGGIYCRLPSGGPSGTITWYTTFHLP